MNFKMAKLEQDVSMNQTGVWYSINECATSQALAGRSSALWRIHTVIKAMSERVHGELDNKLVLVIEDCGCLSEDLYRVVKDLFKKRKCNY